MADVILETKNLTKEFKGFTAVSDVNLRVQRGHIHALIGPNGAGKTTCFNLLTKFLEKNWFIEIHSWLHALSDWFLDMQEQYQYRVAVKPLDDAIHGLVYLKQVEEGVRVDPVLPGSQYGATDSVQANSPMSRPSTTPSAWGSTTIPALSLFPTMPFLTLDEVEKSPSSFLWSSILTNGSTYMDVKVPSCVRALVL